MPDRITNHLCDYALKLSYSDISVDVIQRTKQIILDTVGCALGGVQSPPAKIARAAASDITSAVPATVLVSGQKTSSDLAAFANGVMIRYLDFNEARVTLNDDGCFAIEVLKADVGAFFRHGSFEGRYAILDGRAHAGIALPFHEIA